MKKKQDDVEPRILPKEPDMKDKATEYLRSKGFDAWLQDGIVLCIRESDSTYEDMKKALKEFGYNSSFGVRSKHE